MVDLRDVVLLAGGVAGGAALLALCQQLGNSAEGEGEGRGGTATAASARAASEIAGVRDKSVGVLGGMGPEATLAFWQKVLEKTRVMCAATDDQQHIRAVIELDPKTPNRNIAIAGSAAQKAACGAHMARPLPAPLTQPRSPARRRRSPCLWSARARPAYGTSHRVHFCVRRALHVRGGAGDVAVCWAWSGWHSPPAPTSLPPHPATPATPPHHTATLCSYLALLTATRTRCPHR